MGRGLGDPSSWGRRNGGAIPDDVGWSGRLRLSLRRCWGRRPVVRAPILLAPRGGVAACGPGGVRDAPGVAGGSPVPVDRVEEWRLSGEGVSLKRCRRRGPVVAGDHSRRRWPLLARGGSRRERWRLGLGDPSIRGRRNGGAIPGRRRVEREAAVEPEAVLGAGPVVRGTIPPAVATPGLRGESAGEVALGFRGGTERTDVVRAASPVPVDLRAGWPGGGAVVGSGRS